MKGKIPLYAILAFISVPAIMQPLPVKSEEASAYLTVQIENYPALDVPYVPTPQEVVEKMLSIAGVNSKDILYDLGCGDGRVVVTAAKELRVRRAVGVDIDPKRISESNENARRAGVSGQVSFHQKNLFDEDYRDATVMTLYLLPSVNLKLRPKLLRDLKPGTRIVSHDFDMGDWQPDRQVAVAEHTVYFWVIPANVSGAWTWNLSEKGQAKRYELRLGQRFQKVDSAELRVNGAAQVVRDVCIRGDQMEFVTEVRGEGGKQQLLFQGSVKGNSVSGTLVPLPEKAAARKKWSAERAPSTVIPLDMTTETQIQL